MAEGASVLGGEGSVLWQIMGVWLGRGRCWRMYQWIWNKKPVQVWKSVQRQEQRWKRERRVDAQSQVQDEEAESVRWNTEGFTVIRRDWHQNSGPLRQPGWWHWAGDAEWVMLWGSTHLTWLQTSASELMLWKAFEASAGRLVLWGSPWGGCWPEQCPGLAGCAWWLRAQGAWSTGPAWGVCPAKESWVTSMPPQDTTQAPLQLMMGGH